MLFRSVLGSWATVNGPHYSAVIRDISERKRSESGLRLAASVYANSYEGIIITDPDKTIVDVNPAFTRITGYSRDEVLGRTPKLLASGKHDTAFYKQMWSSIAEHDFWQGEVCNRRSNGELYTEILSLSVIRDSAGKLQHFIGVFSDISLLKAHEEELYRIAHFDMLTGVPNRRLLLDRLSQALLRTRRTGRSVAVCYLDLDGFKLVNDRFGHEGGDKLLVEMTKRLRKVLRTDDTFGRLGGDIRCVVSVSMLTEGWDANTVTHVLGVRAFGTQLLCEQVIGRGRKRKYSAQQFLLCGNRKIQSPNACRAGCYGMGN